MRKNKLVVISGKDYQNEDSKEFRLLWKGEWGNGVDFKLGNRQKTSSQN